MSNEKQDLLDIVFRFGYNVTEISKETGIPTARIYKWKKGMGLPKIKDFEILTKWVISKKEPKDAVFIVSKNNPSIYNKVLTAEQKNEEYEKMIVEINKEKYYLNQELSELKKENEDLKSENKRLKSENENSKGILNIK